MGSLEKRQWLEVIDLNGVRLSLMAIGLGVITYSAIELAASGGRFKNLFAVQLAAALTSGKTPTLITGNSSESKTVEQVCKEFVARMAENNRSVNVNSSDYTDAKGLEWQQQSMSITRDLLTGLGLPWDERVDASGHTTNANNMMIAGKNCYNKGVDIGGFAALKKMADELN